MNYQGSSVAILAFVMVVAGCSDRHAPTASPPRALVGGPLCQAGCNETDPNPTAPGVFLGSAVTPDLCFGGGGYADADADGLGDFCEKNLAAAFAPELYYWSNDDVRRESSWVAGILASNLVRLGYLLSYYRDLGTEAGVCGTVPLPEFWQKKCWPHPGDSEDIYLEVTYQPATSHWVLFSAHYSQHGDYQDIVRSGSAYPTALYYPSHPGAYPRSYVSEKKHANYTSVSACNSGGTLKIDTCEQVNASARVTAGEFQNLGSRAHHALGQGFDCVASADPSYEYYGSGRQECYWTTQEFRGWMPVSAGGVGSDAYSPKLAAFGF